MACVTLPLLSRFGRRQLLISSAAVMCGAMLTSGFFSSRWPGAAAGAAGAAESLSAGGGARWVPPLCVLVYVCASCVGVLSVPWILAAELFPQEVRGSGQAVILSLAHVFMFAALQTYRELNAWLGKERHTNHALRTQNETHAPINFSYHCKINRRGLAATRPTAAAWGGGLGWAHSQRRGDIRRGGGCSHGSSLPYLTLPRGSENRTRGPRGPRGEPGGG
ncbi:hypothetical protein ONE63_008826 [Megalurothrips usitatus]|uniref:Uncharacterized protein n=1 Tax=Megalurothrips usitatus TaxID=439358 RepID=A0AAV7XNI7_9NEOP|nr:hypothetical protein ONE63_008826 [Megalurothrips usitatus]